MKLQYITREYLDMIDEGRYLLPSLALVLIQSVP